MNRPFLGGSARPGGTSGACHYANQRDDCFTPDASQTTNETSAAARRIQRSGVCAMNDRHCGTIGPDENDRVSRQKRALPDVLLAVASCARCEPCSIDASERSKWRAGTRVLWLAVRDPRDCAVAGQPGQQRADRAGEPTPGVCHLARRPRCPRRAHMPRHSSTCPSPSCLRTDHGS
jgi:hypothetical protein